jgi:hypothetical protein
MEIIATASDLEDMFDELEKHFSSTELYNYTMGRTNVCKMVETINQRSEWVEYIRTFPEGKCFMWNNDSTFYDILAAFYADGTIKELDSGNVYLLRNVEAIAKMGVSGFENLLIANHYREKLNSS